MKNTKEVVELLKKSSLNVTSPSLFPRNENPDSFESLLSYEFKDHGATISEGILKTLSLTNDEAQLILEDKNPLYEQILNDSSFSRFKEKPVYNWMQCNHEDANMIQIDKKDVQVTHGDQIVNNLIKNDQNATNVILGDQKDKCVHINVIPCDNMDTNVIECFHINTDMIQLDQTDINVIQGDQTDKNIRKQLDKLMEDNKRLKQINILQLSKIESLLKENESIKKQYSSNLSKSEVSTQYMSDTIDILQKKISALNSRVETYKVNSEEQEKKFKNLLQFLECIPKETLIPSGSNDDINVSKNLIHPYPLSRIINKLANKCHNIKVICRVKPTVQSCLDVLTNEMIYIQPFRNFDQGVGYQLNKVFKGEAKQLDIFEEICPILSSCFSGCNACIITYGQSGSGKTHTMIGSDTEQGIMSLSMDELIRLNDIHPSIDFRFFLTILEIYNENIYDLMNINDEKNSGNVKSKVFIQDDGHKVQLKDVSEAEINIGNQFNYYVKGSLKWRSKSQTSKNVNSSRSHYLVVVRIKQFTDDAKIPTDIGSLTMCDLAGSENCCGLSDKEKTESKFINKSITILNRVFDSMYRRSSMIPFRDSKLTHLLKPCLMGNSKCIFIATVCGKRNNIYDTYRTLNVAKKVELIHFGPSLS